ncbi:AAA family ATPase [Hydrogenophaga sp.]|uniref:AAA family ATPase n=1 Tax=Hydrogenophaga sp. TaxID=1904254 RepID=UPI002FCC16AF
MAAIPFIVVSPRSKHPSVPAPAFVLEQDNWNDYLFRTQYHLSYYALVKSGEVEVTLIGAVKILRKGQTKADGLLVSASFEVLDTSFCSVGQSLDYYERLRELGDIGTHAMKALRDVVAQPELVADFKDEEGWKTSLFRDQKNVGEQFLSLATGLVNGQYAVAPLDQQSFTFSPIGWISPISVDTTSGEKWTFFGKNSLPERVNVIVGRNGSGKSTLLARLARVAYASPSERLEAPVVDLGKLLPEGVGFPRVITVAFSPLDSFKLPGSDDRNRLQIAKDMQRGVGRFSFIGLRDFAAEVEQIGPSETLLAHERKAVDDRVTQTKLKSIEQLAEEFARYMRGVVEKGRGEILKAALDKLERGLFSYDWAALSAGNQVETAQQQFLQCSTGHKIALLVIFGLVANLQSRSLVLFDEPETHLHPPLLSAMMHALRGVLEEYEATAVVATHSPVVVQESMARHVHVIRREESLTAVLPVSTETFGESIGLLTAQIFGLESEATDFHQVLDGLVLRYKSLEAIEGLFKDGVMSHQARAYVLSRLVSRS